METYGSLFQALGDPTRREILERLAGRPQPVGGLASQLPVSRPAVSQHLRVLKEAGLVSERRIGTRRIYAVDPAGVAAIRDYWDRFWRRALSGFQMAAEAEVAAAGNRGDRNRRDREQTRRR